MTEFEKAYQNLNPEQKQAVDTIQGPVLVVAGPGTGKTQILAVRIANILKLTDTNPENILCLTFTEAAVKAMRERLMRFIGVDAYKVNINTYHGFTNEVIQQNPEYFAFSKDLIQIDDLSKIKIIRKIIDEIEAGEYLLGDKPLKKLIPFSDKYRKVKPILDTINNLKKEGINPDLFKSKVLSMISSHQSNPKMFRGKVTKGWETELDNLEASLQFGEIYKLYQEELEKNGYYDFDDMIMFVLEKFSEEPDLLANYQEKYLYLHVDEYQDTNGSQNEVIKKLSSFDDYPNIFAVGDDDQSIYRFQGANLENILIFNDNFKNTKALPITTNYRSTQLILDIAENLIQNNQQRLVKKISNLEKKLKSGKGERGDKAEVWNFNSADEENIYLAKEIQKLHNQGVKYSEIAVIYSKNSLAEDVNKILKNFDIPTNLDIRREVFSNTYIQMLINLMQLVDFSTTDIDIKLYESLLYEFSGIETLEAYRFMNYCSKNKLSLINSLLNIDIPENLADSYEAVMTDNLKNFSLKLQDWHRASKNYKLPHLFELILNESGLLKYLISNVDKNLDDILALNSFFGYLSQQSKINNNWTIDQFFEDMRIIETSNVNLSIPQRAKVTDSVNMTTAHSSKGLEFEYVFIIGATDSNWVQKRSSESFLPKEFFITMSEVDEKETKLEEARRLFFVAVTRAKKKLYITYANDYGDSGSKSASPIRFLKEIDDIHLEKKTTFGDNPEFKIEFEDLAKKFILTEEKTIDEDVKAFLAEKVKDLKLSPSALNKYLESPKKFMLENLVRIPTLPTKDLAMGNAMHYALERLNKSWDGTTFQGLDKFLDDYEFRLEKEFGDDLDFEKTREEGKQILKNYFEKELQQNIFPEIAEVEYNFGFHNLILPADQPILLTGRIDKVEWIDKKNGEVRVVDYKSGAYKTANEIRGLTQNSKGNEWRQLVFYKLMADLDSNFRPNRNLSNAKYKVAEVKLQYIKEYNGKIRFHSFEVTDQDVDKLRELIVEVMRRIRNLEFPEKCDLVDTVNYTDGNDENQ